MKIPGSVQALMGHLQFEGNVARLTGRGWNAETVVKLGRVMLALGARHRPGHVPIGCYTFDDGVCARDVVLDALAIGHTPEDR